MEQAARQMSDTHVISAIEMGNEKLGTQLAEKGHANMQIHEDHGWAFQFQQRC